MMSADSEPNSYSALRRSALLQTLIAIAASLMLVAVTSSWAGFSAYAGVRVIGFWGLWIALTAPQLSLHPFDHLGPANQLTLLRACIVAGLAAAVGEADRSGILLFTASGLAFALDAADGVVARQSGYVSPFGAHADMELDGLFVLVLAGLVATVTDVGPWIWAAGLARYAFIAAASIWPFMRRTLPEAPRRRWACGVGITLLMCALLPTPFAIPSAGLGVFTIVGSFVIDAVWLIRQRNAPC